MTRSIRFARTLSAMSIIALAMTSASPISGQDSAPPKTPTAIPPAEKAFVEFVTRADDHLAKNAPYLVEIESVWKSANGGVPARDGKNRFRVVMGKDRNQFRVEAMKADDKSAPLTVVSDGKVVKHFYAPARIYSVRENDRSVDEIFHDALTANALEGSGVDFLLRNDLREYVLAHVVKIQDLGSMPLDGQPARRFHIELANKKQVDVWFGEGDHPLLRRMSTELKIPTQDKEQFQVTITSDYRWTPGPNPIEPEFLLKLPDDARRVANLFDALVRGDSSDLIGKKLPVLAFTTLGGKETKLADRLGKGPVVLYLWATWCAPSTQNRAAVDEFLDAYKKKGVAFVPINIGESAGIVKAHYAKRDDQGVDRSGAILDPKSTTLDAFRVTALPAAVVLDAEHVIRAISTGSGPMFRAEIGRELDEILKRK